MTCEEFSNEFDVLLNSYNNQVQFGDNAAVIDVTCDEYEKSVFLTDAQKEIVRSLYESSSSSFEDKESTREYLDTLVYTKTYTAEDNTLSIDDTDGSHILTEKYKYFCNIPSDLLYIIFEEVKFSSYISGCENTGYAVVIPVQHDELWHRLNNPFRGTSESRVFRLNKADNIIELVSDYPIGSYLLRYLKEPTPIITTDLPEGLAIEGLSTVTECTLPSILHRKILEAAVSLAVNSKSLGRVATKAGKQE